ncbi:MAG: PQQ-dependent dehydrogenase, methanol/ethanol family, partial [Acidobacteriota bacterium]|nr:PQQ-dependent dehydrogenase, methanol/ethanol family [Acidobacteriota bacterium]
MKRSICAIAVLALGLPLALAANDDLVSRQNDDDQWVLPGKNYSATRYSSLDDITADNVANLTQVWSFSTGALRGHEGQPLVVDSTMYVHSAY